MSLASFTIVSVGGAIGASARYGISLLFARFVVNGFPVATLSVNLLGSFIMGALIAWFGMRNGLGGPVHLFLATGILGGFTTFSAFSMELVALIERRAYGLAVTYCLVSVVAGLLLAALGYWLVRRYFS